MTVTVAKLKTKKRNRLDVDELRAHRHAYGGKLGRKDYFKYIGLPAFLFALVITLLLYNIWVSVAFAIIGAIYGSVFFLPKSIKKEYEQAGFRQRNKFLNNITQVLTDENHTVLMALSKVKERADGEFKEDLERFHAMLIGGDNEIYRTAVIWFGNEYKEDIIFLQYLEQLETALIEGKTNIDTLKDIKTYHNEIQSKQQSYEAAKVEHLKNMKIIAGLIIGLIVVLSFSFGFDTYISAFAHHPVGWVTSGIFTTINIFFFIQFSGYLFDDSVMDIKK